MDELNSRTSGNKEPNLASGSSGSLNTSEPKTRFKMFDGMTWPLPDNDLEWRLRYAPDSMTRQDEMHLASMNSAYRELIVCSREKREKIVRELRKEIQSALQKVNDGNE